MKILNLLTDYLYLTKKNETETDNKAIKAMHMINRVSLLLFLFALMVMISKMITQALLK